MTDAEMRDMLIDYMGKGFLDNIIALLRQEPDLCRHIPDLLGNEQIRVRLGAVALVEELVRDRRQDLKAAVPGLIGLLAHENPTIRGDAANVLGIIGDAEAVAALTLRLRDDHPGVREAVRDALQEIAGTGGRG